METRDKKSLMVSIPLLNLPKYLQLFLHDLLFSSKIFAVNQNYFLNLILIFLGDSSGKLHFKIVLFLYKFL